jgi:hypothetical protein
VSAVNPIISQLDHQITDIGPRQRLEEYYSVSQLITVSLLFAQKEARFILADVK